MEIQKIFSDQYGEERLFSVLMNEGELSLYQEMFSDNKEAKVAGGVAAGTALAGGGIYGANKHGKKLIKKGNDIRSKAIAEALETGADWEKEAKQANELNKRGARMTKPAEAVSDAFTKAKDWMTQKELKEAIDAQKSKVDRLHGAAKTASERKLARMNKALSRGKAGRIAGGVAAGTALAAGTAYGVHKRKVRKNNEN